MLMLAIWADVLRFPLIKRERGSLFFTELSVAYSLFLVITILIHLGEEGVFLYPLKISMILWILHFTSFPVLLFMWMHFNALNVVDNEKLVNMLTYIHSAPLIVFLVISAIDITRQKFYPFNLKYEHMLPSMGTYYFIILSLLFCVIMMLSTLGHRKKIKESFLFIVILMPISFTISVVVFFLTHTYGMFILTNSIMLVLYYLLGQRDFYRTDALTGLATYTLLKHKLVRIFRSQAPYAVILLDIENFRYFNSRYGKSQGDQMLVSLAKYLGTLVESNEIYRISNDQFCLSVSIKDGRTVQTLIDTITERMAHPWQLTDRSVHIQVNIAVITIPQQVKSLEEFSEVSEKLMFELKMLKDKTLIVYTRESTTDYERKQNIVSALRESIKNPDQIILHYQPVYDTKSEQMVFAEALMRIQDKHLGFIRPNDFIFLAEQIGLITPLSQIVLSKICKCIKQLPIENTPLKFISMNLSGEDFELVHFKEVMLDIIERENINPKYVNFEITESVLLQSYETVTKAMVALSKKDITFSLDDFGTGYSNLSSLIDLPYDYVKLDRSIILAGMTNYNMLQMLTEMIHKMGKLVIAEGVETKEQLLQIRNVGIDMVQGYYFSMPLSEEDFRMLFK